LLCRYARIFELLFFGCDWRDKDWKPTLNLVLDEFHDHSVQCLFVGLATTEDRRDRTISSLAVMALGAFPNSTKIVL